MNKVLEVVLKLTDQFSAPLRQSETGLQGFGSKLGDLAKNAVTFGAIAVGIRKGFEALDEFRVATLKLEGTAKITGVALADLNAIAQGAQQQFGLSKAQAADFAVEMAKLATKAGDVGLAGPALQKFLDIGAARGLTAAETLKAVQQSILGIDEGTDKLFNANPSVLYAKFAEAIGTTAAKLTDQQKAQALLTAAMTDGGKVVGAYGDFLNTTAGQIELTKNRTQEFYAALGELLDPARKVFYTIVEGFANIGIAAVKGWEMLGATLVAGVMNLPAVFQKALGMAATVISDFVSVAANLAGPLSKPFERMAESIGAWGTKTVATADASLKETSDVWTDRMLEIQGIQTEAEASLTAGVKKGGKDRVTATTQSAADRAKAEKDAAKNLADLQGLAYKAELALLSAQEREYLEMVRVFHEKMQGLNAEQYAEAEALLKRTHVNMLMAWSGFGDRLVPTLSSTIKPALKGMATDFSDVADAAIQSGETIEQAGHEKWGRFKEQVVATSTAIGKGAEEILRFGRDIGVTNPQLEALVGGIGRLAEGIGGIASGNLIQGITSGILGLQGIVGTLFGNSPAEMARRKLLRDNTEGLERLRAGMGDLLRATTPGGKLASFGEFANEFTPDQAFDGRSRGGSGALAKVLAKYGLTIADLNDIAKQEGVDFDFTKFRGGADMQVLNILLDKIKASEYGQFGQDSFGDRLDYLDRYFDVAGITDPGQQARFTEAEIAKFSPYLADLIKQFDINTPEGRAGLQQAFAGIFQNLNNGTFDVANFGQLNGAEFVEFIEYFTDLMGEIGGGLPTLGGATTGSGATMGGGSTFSGVTFTGGTVDLNTALFAPVGMIATNTTDLVTIMRDIRDTGITVTVRQDGGGAGGGIGVTLDAINLALASDADLASAAGVA